MTDWDKVPKEFLAGWLNTLLESIQQNLDEETRQKIFNETGSYCANAHIASLFKEIKTESNDPKRLVEILNEKLKGTKWELVDDNKLKVIYERCYCPLIGTKVVKSEVQCDCSVGWLKENLEILFNKEVQVELQGSVVRGANQCTFLVNF